MLANLVHHQIELLARLRLARLQRVPHTEQAAAGLCSLFGSLLPRRLVNRNSPGVRSAVGAPPARRDCFLLGAVYLQPTERVYQLFH